ncbi:MAG: adenylate/guanylate cyclase domain-containing protein [Proteobacteria bacterium]|nr:adenylate/guanylate cyclase domain-containing protein [Pseudomonadota bacterium]MDA1057797.1 adenylate/guanylate cyclase domain-containing protein [Pseudomonadota bacterium]
MARARLIAGIILYIYVATHLINHALGILSLEAMEVGRDVFLAVWRNPIGGIVLYGAILTHVLLVLWSLYRRRTLRMPLREVLQISFGLLLPILLLEHIVATRGMHQIAGINDTYGYVLSTLWVSKPGSGALQSLALVLAWAHGSMGLYFWLRLKPWFGAVAPWLFAAVILMPVLALVGFVDGGRELVRLLEDDAFVDRLIATIGPADEAEVARGVLVLFWGRIVFGTLLGLVVLGRIGRWAVQQRAHMVTVTYADGRKIAMEPGATVLDASRRLGVPHASVCGGRGRCSTCRVHVSAGRESLPAPSSEESRVLLRVGASDATRLACQLRPTDDLTVAPLLGADATAKDGHRKSVTNQGAEREVAILFADIRSFTAFSEKKLPYDVVFVLNQYFRTMGGAVEQAGGQLDKFIGDGVMALFGIETDAAAGCRAAIEGARRMAIGLKELNENLKNDLPEPLRIGIGIHVGSVIVGDMGYAATRSITAIGDPVNTASRLESLNKDYVSQLVVSGDVAERAGIDLSIHRSESVEVRGRAEPLQVFILNDASALKELVRA